MRLILMGVANQALEVMATMNAKVRVQCAPWLMLGHTGCVAVTAHPLPSPVHPVNPQRVLGAYPDMESLFAGVPGADFAKLDYIVVQAVNAILLSRISEFCTPLGGYMNLS
jgi:hypothetical protein